MLEANSGAKRTVCGYGIVDVSRIEIEPCLTNCCRVEDGQRNDGWLASTGRDRR